MAAIIDTGFLYATIDAGDQHHARVMALLPTLTDDLVIPTTTFTEITYLLQARLGHAEMRRFIRQLERSPLRFEPLRKSDLSRIREVLEQYADAKLDFVDASIVALAERLRIRRILTVDQRDFRIIRPRHCDYFDLLP